MRRMDLKTLLSQKSTLERDALAAECETTRGHLQNVMYGLRSCSPELANALEQATGGQVTRQDLCPNDFWKIWPDLAHLAPAEQGV